MRTKLITMIRNLTQGHRMIFQRALLAGLLMSLFSAPVGAADTKALQDLDWAIVNDTVMGGRSEATIQWDKQGAMVWSGYLSLENNGGFVSIRSSGSTFDWSDYQGVEVILEGNGRDVQVSAQRLDRMIRAGGYRALVPTVLQGETRIYIPFTAFELKRFGRSIQGPPLTQGLSKIGQIGLLMADKREGPFRVQLKSIRPVRANRTYQLAKEVGPQLVGAIEQGVPLFNQGNAQGCAVVYRQVLQALLEKRQLGEQTWARLTARQALKASTNQNWVDAAWTLRRAMDQILQSLAR